VKKLSPGSASARANWIQIELLDEDGNGVTNAPYELHLANGAVKKGRLDGSGKARVDDLPSGSCRVVFPDEERRGR
jgi:type VI secretion system secreted protein VgrG